MSIETRDIEAVVNQALWEVLQDQHPGVAAKLQDLVNLGQTPERIEAVVVARTEAGPLLAEVIACAAQHLWTQRELVEAANGAVGGGSSANEQANEQANRAANGAVNDPANAAQMDPDHV